MSPISPIHLSSSLQLRSPCRDSSCYERKINASVAVLLLRKQSHHFIHDVYTNDALRGAKPILTSVSGYTKLVSLISPSKWASSAMPFAVASDYGEQVSPQDFSNESGKDMDSIYFLLQITHESARIVSDALIDHESDRNYLKPIRSWICMGMDGWHKHICYQAAVYALLKTVMEMESTSVSKHLVYDILSPKVDLLVSCIEGSLGKKDPDLVKWFKTEQISVLTEHFTPFLESWASGYANRNIAVVLLASSCCVGVSKLGTQCIACPAFTICLPEMMSELMDSLHGLTSIRVLHQLATKAGILNEFLCHFGSKVLLDDRKGEIIFWMQLLQRKLVAAFARESVVVHFEKFCETQVLATDLAIVGLFAFLGRRTRLFLSEMGIKDLDELVKEFLCYLECGVLFVYPELSSICVHQLFMEVLNEEIGWLDLYAEVPCQRKQERKQRSKPRAVQAEKEIVLSVVYGSCSELFSSFASYSENTQQSMDANLGSYLHRIRDLLVACLEDYWAAYDRRCALAKITEIQCPKAAENVENIDMMKAPESLIELLQLRGDPVRKEIAEPIPHQFSGISKSRCSDRILEKFPQVVETNNQQSLFARSSSSVISAISDIWLGSQLLFIDLTITIALVQKKVSGYELTKREGKKISRLVTDIACIIPIAILMIIPVTAIGHAAILTSINNYLPHFIPSQYSVERLNNIKQLKRAKMMKLQKSRSTTSVSS